MLVKFPVWEYHNTQLGFSLQLNSNTKKDFRFLRIKSPFLYSWSYYFTAPFFYCHLFHFLDDGQDHRAALGAVEEVFAEGVSHLGLDGVPFGDVAGFAAV